ncbi:ABC transporter permease [Pontivivens insulae]|uniref:Spermidine/putrescine transport system permease protein PotB n=1 Tax=Pontivivens insulae TaxID=1639689 RepID=A0A2R8AFE4_9RHOB|nr:ABC transporter permease [Pontivivens insulae]RED12161.1 putative spermidine/putrescine transport system permease protein [Pontivivens insulae]SPF30917.1 Spermidine/putrescine transport system permease protein PotB [Pontivivens insulae]
MSSTDMDTGPVLAADGTPLKKSLARALRRQKMRALMLIAPLLLFILITFLIPIGQMLLRSVDNEIVSATIPRTVQALEDWEFVEGGAPPGEAVFEQLYEDMLIATEQKIHTRLGSRLNYEMSGMSSLFRKTNERRLGRFDLEEPLAPQFADIDEDWLDPEVWFTIQSNSDTVTAGYFLAAVDLQRTPDGIESVPDFSAIYVKLFVRTIILSVTITFTCLILGYPIAWLLSNLPAKSANLLLILVLLPFWTSLLVRTSAWKVLLQQQGVINDILVWIGLVADDNRLALINNATGTVIAMTHILLPFMILPLYSVMKTIPPSYVRAAKSLGATDWTAFWRVYFPQSVPGIGAGAILVFILAIGYYITPELVGGTDGTFISNRIYYHISSSLNWGLAAALATILLALVMVLYWIYDRMVGIDNVKLG